MRTRTDLVSEERELHPDPLTGAERDERQFGDVNFERVKITTQGAAAVLKRPIGSYITVRFDTLNLPHDGKDITQALIRALAELMPEKRDSVLVVGLGNRDITPDAVGPLVADRLFATRHIDAALVKALEPMRLRSVAVSVPGVIGKTGIEAMETVRGTVARIRPDAVIVVDALAARRPERLCRTVQLCDTGICPGSGVQNSRREFSRATLGVPVIAVGVPTVVDVASLIGEFCDPSTAESTRSLMVTPKDIDFAVLRSAEIISRALNLFLQPDLDEKTLIQLV